MDNEKEFDNDGILNEFVDDDMDNVITLKDEETGEKISSLVTVWAIPQNLKNQVLGLQKKKKEEAVNG